MNLRTRRLVLAVALVLTGALAGCKKKGLDGCGVSVGSCVAGAASCGAEFSCEDRKLQLKCAPGMGKPPMECDCIENGVLQKHVQLVTTNMGGLDEARATASTACGWAR